MAGQARQRGTGGTGRSSRAASPSLAAVVQSAAVSGSDPGLTSSILTTTAMEPARPVPPATRAGFRTLLMRGLEPEEAANLTAFMNGIPLTERSWKLNEVNRLLFLRELNRQGRIGGADEAGSLLH